MPSFDTIKDDVEHAFARENPRMLQTMFGTEELTPFWLADMDFEIARPITDELQRLVDRGIYAYEFAAGDVFEAIVGWMMRRHQLALDSKAYIQVNGVLTGIAVMIRELTEPGDGIVIQPPVYHQFARLITSAGRKIIRNPLKIEASSYKMDLDDLEQKLTSENVKMILLCSPHNPVGRVWTKDELERLVAIADQHSTTIVSDEIHSDIVYQGHKFNSIGAFGDKKHVALLGSPAKTFGMHSISNGYLYIPDETLQKQVQRTVESMYLNHGNAFTTFGTIAAFKQGDDWLDELLAYLEKSIDWITRYINAELSAVKMYPVEGTYQVWLDFSKANLTKNELYSAMAKQGKLALTPGNWFGPGGDLFMRMNIASPLRKIQKAFEQIALVLQ